jgi:hypothetical protein
MVWECKDSDACQNVGPTDPAMTNIWTLISGKPQKVSTPEIAYHHALPFYFLQYFPDIFILIKGEYVQHESKVYSC